MNAIGTNLKDAYLITNNKFGDERGFFMESFNLKEFRKIVTYDVEFVQDNHSFSYRNVLRGLHYQIEKPQGKLVRCIRGQVLDVSVDLRINSATYGQVFYVILSDKNKRSVYIPEGFAHGFIVQSDEAEFVYKVTDYYYKEGERCLVWNDKTLGIDWGISNPILSEKDASGLTWEQAPKFK